MEDETSGDLFREWTGAEVPSLWVLHRACDDEEDDDDDDMMGGRGQNGLVSALLFFFRCLDGTSSV